MNDTSLKSSPVETVWQVEGMHCADCADTIQRFLKKKGIRDSHVDFINGTVKFPATHPASDEELARGIHRLGYHVVKKAEAVSNVSKKPFFESLSGKLTISALLTFPLLLRMIFPNSFLSNPYFQWLLSTPVVFIGLQTFGKSAWGSLLQRKANMYSLILLGSVAAYIFSLINLFILENNSVIYFETAAAIITFALLGSYIEKRAVKRTHAALDALIDLLPKKALLIDFFGDEKFEVITETDISNIRKGNYLLVRQGDRVAADGEVVWGEGFTDESIITGESLPLQKKLQSKVIAGTLLTDGTLKIKVEAAGDDSSLSHIIQLMEDAQRHKPSIQRIADRITMYFVPAVLAIATLTFVFEQLLFHFAFTQALLNAIAILVVACPCAMGLATPTAITVAIGKAAKRGILVKDAASLEKFQSIDAVVFDKTGTITTGNFKVAKVKAIGVEPDELKKLTAALERYSSHPIAKAITREWTDFTFNKQLSSIHENKGISIEGMDENGNHYAVGSFAIAEKLTNDDSWNVYVLRNDQLIGMILLEDEIRAGAASMLQFFKSQNLKTYLLSGDKQDRVENIGSNLHFDEVFFEKKPQEKLEIIQQLQKKNSVAMVGDGVNDAPALSLANVGISMSHATEAATNSAQIILLNNQLELIPDAFDLSRATLKTIRQNLWWALAYNICLIPLAAIGLLPPMWGALSMAISDIIVVGNSLRLHFKPVFSLHETKSALDSPMVSQPV